MSRTTLPPGTYATPTLPGHWVEVTPAGELWLYPAGNGGWEQRVPFRGYATSLRRAVPETIGARTHDGD